MSHFLQSNAWARFQQSLGRTVITESGDGWHYVAVLEKGQLSTRLYCPYGPVAVSAAGFTAALTSLKQQGRQHRASFLRIEPLPLIDHTILRQHGFHQATHVQPEYTWQLDLTASEAELIAQMSQANRNLYRNYTKKGLTVHVSHDPKDITILTHLLHGVAAATGMRPHSDHYFTQQAATLLPDGDASLYYMSLNDTPIAACLVYDSPTTRYYAHAAADYAHRKLGAGSALVSYMIIDAKRRGQHTFDFYGIAPPNQPHHPWAGFTRFKQSFGGEAKALSGTWELPLKPLNYRLYRLLRTLLRR